jgi:hypothetical protein
MEKYSVKVRKDVVKELFNTENDYHIKQFNIDDDNNIQSIVFVDKDGNEKKLKIQHVVYNSNELSPETIVRVCNDIDQDDGSTGTAIYNYFCKGDIETQEFIQDPRIETYLEEENYKKDLKSRENYNTEICNSLKINPDIQNEEDRKKFLVAAKCGVKQSESKKSNMIVIIGASVGGIIILALIIFLTIYLRRK